jgi:hypothetical protein
LNPDGKKIAGYYTLSSYTVQLDEIQEEIRRKWTRKQEIPAILLERLARSLGYHAPGKRAL